MSPGAGAERTTQDVPVVRGASEAPAPGARAPRHRRGVRLTFVALAVLLGAAVVWLAWSASQARTALLAAQAEVGELQSQVRAGEVEAARATLVQIQDHAALARVRTAGPLWASAGVVPGVGPHVRAVQTVARAVDDLARDALPSLVAATAVVDPSALAPVDGRIDLAPLVAVAPQLEEADAAVRVSLGRLDALDVDRLLPQVAGPVDELRRGLAAVGADTATAARAARLLPAMLGADGPREHLLLVQNNAEPRALGGMPGAVILLRADAGAVELVELRNAGGTLSGLPEPALPLTDVERSLFGEQLGIYMADVTFTPDFPRAAAMAQAIWEQRVGGHIDGVVSIDTGGLAAVLGATGPVDLPPGPVAQAVGGRLTAQNAVEVLNNTVYRLVEDTAAQDAFYAETGAAIFRAALAGAGDPVTTVGALAAGAEQGQLLVWSAHPQEQALLAGTVLSGELRGVRDEAPVLGLYVNDGTGSKIGYYLDADVQVRPGACATDGTRLVHAEVTFTSTAPPDVVDMPPYISGGGVLEPGRMRFNVLAYAPQDGYVESVEVSDGSTGGASHRHDGLLVVARTVELSPGESTVLRYELRTGVGQHAAPQVRTTSLVDVRTAVHEGWRC